MQLLMPRFIPAHATTANATTAAVIIPNVIIIFFLSQFLLTPSSTSSSLVSLEILPLRVASRIRLRSYPFYYLLSFFLLFECKGNAFCARTQIFQPIFFSKPSFLDFRQEEAERQCHFRSQEDNLAYIMAPLDIYNGTTPSSSEYCD